MIKVAVNGYGTIGRRVADAIAGQPDMELVGVAKSNPDYKSKLAQDSKIAVYAVDEKSLGRFEEAGAEVNGTLDQLLRKADVVVDASPEGMGETNKQVYERVGLKALFQGGEEHMLTGTSFNAYANYREAVGKQSVRVVSCNTTGLIRTLFPLRKEFGITGARATIIRRATDPDDSSRGPIDSIVPEKELPSHHGPDVETVMHGLEIETAAVKVPTTRMHLHYVSVTLGSEASVDRILAAWEKYSRITLFSFKSGVDSTARMMDYARELNRPRGDLYEIGVWDSIWVKHEELRYFQAVHQEADVVPENIDAIRALIGESKQKESIKTTDAALGIDLSMRRV